MRFSIDFSEGYQVVDSLGSYVDTVHIVEDAVVAQSSSSPMVSEFYFEGPGKQTLELSLFVEDDLEECFSHPLFSCGLKLRKKYPSFKVVQQNRAPQARIVL